MNLIDDEYNNSNNNTILKREIEKWHIVTLLYWENQIETYLIKCYNHLTNIQMQ